MGHRRIPSSMCTFLAPKVFVYRAGDFAEDICGGGRSSRWKALPPHCCDFLFGSKGFENVHCNVKLVCVGFFLYASCLSFLCLCVDSVVVVARFIRLVDVVLAVHGRAAICPAEGTMPPGGQQGPNMRT